MCVREPGSPPTHQHGVSSRPGKWHRRDAGKHRAPYPLPRRSGAALRRNHPPDLPPWLECVFSESAAPSHLTSSGCSPVARPGWPATATTIVRVPMMVCRRQVRVNRWALHASSALRTYMGPTSDDCPVLLPYLPPRSASFPGPLAQVDPQYVRNVRQLCLFRFFQPHQIARHSLICVLPENRESCHEIGDKSY